MEYPYQFVRHWILDVNTKNTVYNRNMGFATKANYEFAAEPSYKLGSRKAFISIYILRKVLRGDEEYELMLETKVMWCYFPLVVLTNVAFEDSEGREDHYQISYINQKRMDDPIRQTIIWRAILPNTAKGVPR